MKQKLTLRLFIVRLTGFLFAAYSLYYAFIIVRDIRWVPPTNTVISALVSLLFASLVLFAWTSEVNNLKFIRARRVIFIITLSSVLLLKLRLAGGIITLLDFSNKYAFLYALYGTAYFATLTGMLILLIYYTFIRKNMPLYPKVSRILPLTAMVLFVLGLTAESVLFFGYRFGLEGNILRTVVSRPVFYLSFIGLSAYFLYPPRIEETAGYIPPDDSEYIKPIDEAEYVPPEGIENIKPNDIDYIQLDDGEYIPPKGSEHIKSDSKYIQPKGNKRINVDDSEFIMPDDAKYIPPKGAEKIKPDNTDYFTSR